MSEWAGVSWGRLMGNDYGALLRGLAVMALTHEGDCEGDYRVHKNSKLQLLVPETSLWDSTHFSANSRAVNRANWGFTGILQEDSIQGGKICEPVGSQPFQNGVFVKEVVSVNAREFASEVDERRHLVDPVLLGVPRVVHLDHGDVQRVRFVVDLLQAFNRFVAFNTVVFVWEKVIFTALSSFL